MRLDNSFKMNTTFRGERNNFGMNACVGVNGGPYDHADLAKGFLECASKLVETAEKREITIDIAVYPICLAYRQSIELWLKGIIVVMENLWKIGNPEPHGHKLVPLFNKLLEQKASLQKFAIRPDDFELLERAISDWNEIDPRGLSFRYPGDKLGSQYLADWRLINLTTLRDETNTVCEILERCFFQISEGRDGY